MPSRAEQRQAVWKGQKRRTSGGLTRDDLMLNRSGRIVSKRKSLAASKVNNLGDWLRNKGQKFKDVPAKAKKGTNGKPKKIVKAAPKVVKAKPAPVKAKPAPVKPKPKPVKAKPKPVKPKPVKPRKLDSKKTVNVLKKVEAIAKKNQKAGVPIKTVPEAEKPEKKEYSDYGKHLMSMFNF